MYNLAIKICGIRTPEIAREAAMAGANYISMIFHPKSKRFVNVAQAREISIAANENGAKPVAVFVYQSAIEMEEICIAANIQIIQLHGSNARKQHRMLPMNYQRLYVQSVSPNGDLNHDDDGGLTYCLPERDYIVFDNTQAGKGQPFNWNNFNYPGSFRMCLAGGLTPENVAVAIKKFQPAIVDVSSGVENLYGEKDITIIKEFILSVRGVDHGNQ